MLKSTAGGGGIGMRVCRSAAELSESFEAVKRLGQNNFSDAGVFIEKYISAPGTWKCRCSATAVAR
jgi:urea carboxylase